MCIKPLTYPTFHVPSFALSSNDNSPMPKSSLFSAFFNVIFTPGLNLMSGPTTTFNTGNILGRKTQRMTTENSQKCSSLSTYVERQNAAFFNGDIPRIRKDGVQHNSENLTSHYVKPTHDERTKRAYHCIVTTTAILLILMSGLG